MNNEVALSASLVLYQNDPDIVSAAVTSLLNTPLNIYLFVVDNSPLPSLAPLLRSFNVDYYHNQGQNTGFGKAHNLALKKVKRCNYHLVLNPDVYFGSHVIPELISYLEEHQDIGLISPKICFPDGETQYLCKRYPSLLLLFSRRFIPQRLQFLFKKRMDYYEMRETGYNQVMDVPYLSGCFMLFRRNHLDKIGYFDENIFLYLEDADITLRMSKEFRAVFYPQVHIFHYWAKGAYKSTKLALVTIQSAIYLFNKHGWKIL